MISGFPIITSPYLTEIVLFARSPSRANRRARQGHRQNWITVPRRDVLEMPNGSLIMHPETYASLVKEMRTTGDARQAIRNSFLSEYVP